MISITKCPDCGHENFFVNKEKGEVICRNCSFVIDDALFDFGKERIMDSEDAEKKSRSGAPFDPTIANNLITDVGNDSDIRKLPRNAQYLMKRIREKNRWSSSAIEQNLSNGLGILKIFSSGLMLADMIEKEAARLYRDCAIKGITRARSTERIVAGCIFISAKVNSVPKSLNEISEITKIDKHIIVKTYKMILRELGLKIIPSSPVDFIGRFASELKLDAKIQTQAVSMIEKIRRMGLNSGKNPSSLAATTLYISALLNKKKVTQKNMADTAGITETTLRNRCKEISEALDINKKLLKKSMIK